MEKNVRDNHNYGNHANDASTELACQLTTYTTRVQLTVFAGGILRHIDICTLPVTTKRHVYTNLVSK